MEFFFGGGGGPKGMLAPPSQIIGEASPPCPAPSSYAYGVYVDEVAHHVDEAAHDEPPHQKLHYLQILLFSSLGLQGFLINTWHCGAVGWCDGPGKASSAGASYNLDDSMARAYCTCSRWGVVWTFLFSSILSLIFLPLSGRRLDTD